ncbi:transposase [Dongia soli]|uniref:Transposase n=1 Tax=Dongia soli TaxID=600628 RepID=A0ABU5EG70_9PROT|nr:transposase [Dongia soli]MDY0885403.1 transposase [Dongia soli]
MDRRLPENQNGKRQCIIAMRERQGRTIATVVPGELSDVAWDLVEKYVQKPASLRADEHPAYNDLLGLFSVARNNHSVAYVSAPGASTNQAESFFSRVRKAAKGFHHRMSGKYLNWYVADLAWREDMRRHPLD